MKFRTILLCVFLVSAALLFSNADNLKLATTTSTENSGLLAYILPEFEKDTGIKVSVISVGTGKALKLGENGDVDVVLVHARALEDKFVADGYGVKRFSVCYNDFVVVGPKNDPAKISNSKSASEALKRILENGSLFISRGDNSGTHQKELELWSQISYRPSGKWYQEAGRGMEEVLMMAKEQRGYTLTDRGTYLAILSKTDLVILHENDKALFNPYGVIAVNPKKHPHIKIEKVNKFINWLTSDRGQSLIGSFKVNNLQLFFPSLKE